jgi:HlyD family secretion protein
MKFAATLQKVPAPLRRPWLAAGVLLAILVVAFLVVRPGKVSQNSLAFFEVKRGDFTVTVVEGGALSAVSEVVVRSEVEGTARIISIVPEGSYAKKGDLLIELDSSQAEDQVNLQQINFEKVKFAVEQARAQLEIMKSATNSDYLAAVLKLKFARIDREKYLQGQRMVELVEASNKVVQAEAQLSVNLDTYLNSTNLAAKGYETKQRADSDRLSVLNARNTLIVATNSLWMLQQFDSLKQQEKFDSDVLQAEQELDRVVSQNRRKMAQYEADLSSQITTLQLSEDKLERDRKNLAGTKIYAPQEGLVVYQIGENRWSSESLVEAGAVVRNRQDLIKLPDLSRMKVTVKIHETHVNLIRPGLPAFVVLDSMPEERFPGVVEKVAPLPDSQSRWGNPNLKVYNTDIYLDQAIPNVKPGVSAKAEIVVTNISNALSVPIQCVTTLKGKQVAYVQRSGQAEPRPVETGMFNTKFVEIVKGLNPGDRVLLSPPFDTQEKDLDGAILSPEDRARAATNRPPRQPGRQEPPGVVPERGPGSPIVSTGPPGSGGGREAQDGQGFPNANASKKQGGPSREDLLKRFDKNGNGKLDEDEIAAMRASSGEDRPARGERRNRGGDEGGRGPRDPGKPNT